MIKEEFISLLKSKIKIKNISFNDQIKKRLSDEFNFFQDNAGILFSLDSLILDGKKSKGNKANSLILYILDIVEDLPDFEKEFTFKKDWFPTRFSAPDIDMDFENNRPVQERAENIYGDRFIYIGTYGQWGIKAAIQNASKYCNFTMPNENAASTAIILSKAISKFAKTFDEAVDGEDFLLIRKRFPEIEEVIQNARKIYEQKCSIGKHAGGVIICDVPVQEICPYFVVEETIDQKKTGRFIRVSQFNDKDCELLGLLKADFLGVKNLESTRIALDMIKASTGKLIDIEKIDVLNKEQNDQILDLFRKGLTAGIFQFEGHNITNFLKEMQPSTFYDIVAANALYRPGPKDNGYHTEYCIRKKNKNYSYPHIALKDILESTYGLWVYQEQLMKGSGILAGFSSTEQDELRRIIGKKDLKKLPKMKEKFVKRCIDNKVINEENANKIWEQFEKFGNYAFNKAHAVSYAKISYQNAFLKKYFPREFFAANMTRELRKASADDKDSNLKHYENEAKNYFGIELLEPCINKSKTFYTIEKIDGRYYLRKPFTYISGIGDEAEKEIVAKQPYSSIEDFYIRQTSKVLNIKVMTGLLDNNCLSVFGERDYIEKEILRCKEIKDASSNKQKSIMKKMIPKMNGVL